MTPEEKAEALNLIAEIGAHMAAIIKNGPPADHSKWLNPKQQEEIYNHANEAESKIDRIEQLIEAEEVTGTEV